MEDTPEIEIELLLLEKLQQKFASIPEFEGVIVESDPGGDEESYAAIGIKGCVLLRFNDESLAIPPSMLGGGGASNSQVNQIEYVCLAGVASSHPTNPHHQALRYMHAAKLALKGVVVQLQNKLQIRFWPSRIKYHNFENEVWWYYILIRSEPY